MYLSARPTFIAVDAFAETSDVLPRDNCSVRHARVIFLVKTKKKRKITFFLRPQNKNNNNTSTYAGTVFVQYSRLYILVPTAHTHRVYSSQYAQLDSFAIQPRVIVFFFFLFYVFLFSSVIMYFRRHGRACLHAGPYTITTRSAVIYVPISRHPRSKRTRARFPRVFNLPRRLVSTK